MYRTVRYKKNKISNIKKVKFIFISIIMGAIFIFLAACSFSGEKAETISSNTSPTVESQTDSSTTYSPATNASTINSSASNADSNDQVLSKAEMLEDYDTMWEIIEENYPYMGVAERTTKKDFKKIEDDYYIKLKDVKNEQEFGELIDACLKEFEYTGHMSMIAGNEYAAYLKLYNNASYSWHTGKLFKTLNNDISKRFYNYTDNSNETVPDDKSNGGTTAKSQSNETKAIQFSTKKYDGLKTAYIKIPNFSDPQTNVPGLIEFFKSISAYKNCIIDIRGNGGGSDSYWTEGVVNPNLTKDASYSNYMLVKGEKSANYVKDELSLLPIKILAVTSMPKLNTEDLANVDYLCKSVLSYHKSDNPFFTGKFYVLTDGKDYSAAEAFAVFCKSTGFATLIGERTGGDGIGFDPMISVLPNSGICFRFSALYGLNPDGGSNEEYGTEPDVACDGEKALDVCLNMIKGKN